MCSTPGVASSLHRREAGDREALELRATLGGEHGFAVLERVGPVA